tara:strand:+ start:145 stop:756 length:612 start_codon:yes stop_codon:yes gene_type:complete
MRLQETDSLIYKTVQKMAKSNGNYAKITSDLKDRLRMSFVQGIPDAQGFRRTASIESLAQEHNLSVNTLYKLAQREDWKGQRHKFDSEYQGKLDQQRIKDMAEESRKFDSACLSIAKGLISRVGANLRDAQDKDATEFTPSQLDSLAGAALKAQKFAKLALGENTDNISINADIRDDNSFRRAMEMLDELEQAKRSGSVTTTH